MTDIITINGTELAVKEYNERCVVTFKEIDELHDRPEGTARKRFNDNKQHFIEGEDYYVIDQPSEIRTLGFERPQGGIPEKVVLITESGYLMIVKSLKDDLAWKVQRELVNSYFRIREVRTEFSELSPQLQLLINIETEQKRQQKAIEDTNRRIDNIGEVIALDVNSWRREARSLITKIAQSIGGFNHIKDVNSEVYRLVEERAGVRLDTRLTNKRMRMADEGVCKSKRDKLTKVDIIADDKKLIEIYIAIVKEMAIKYSVDLTD